MRKLWIPLLVCALLLVSGGVALAQSGSAGYYNFTSNVIFQYATQFLGTSTFTGDVVSNGTITGTTVTSTFLGMTQGVTQSIGASAAISPVASYQPISSTGGAIGTSLITLKPTGTMLRLVNVGADVITITDTGTLLLSGNIALGTSDSLLLMSDGTNWIMLGTSNN